VSCLLEVARGKALELVAKLAPHCERVEIAGSIRRGKKQVKDIDLVAIPKMASSTTLLGVTDDVSKTDFYAAVRGELWSITAEGTKLIRGTSYISRGGNPPHTFATRDESISVDIYLATVETWATLLLIRTGSAEHNIWLASRAKSCGGRLHADGSGLELPGQYDPLAQRNVNMRVLRPQSEEEVFKALGIPFAEPRERECVNARPVWMSN
jgi:DNA polymerase/3'-5' exonuclease PolX